MTVGKPSEGDPETAGAVYGPTATACRKAASRSKQKLLDQLGSDLLDEAMRSFVRVSWRFLGPESAIIAAAPPSTRPRMLSNIVFPAKPLRDRAQKDGAVAPDALARSRPDR